MSTPLNLPDFQFVSQLVRQRSAIVLEVEKSYLLEARLTPLARAEGFTSLEAMIGQMRTQPFNGLHRKVVGATTRTAITPTASLCPATCSTT